MVMEHPWLEHPWLLHVKAICSCPSWKWGLVLPDWLGGLSVALVKHFCELGLLPRAGVRLLGNELELTVRYPP